ncbi:MAG: selenocysteine-specific translation elongation factor [Chloroflexi bacterium]|nr:selenocysteine-specific translation elongation factor [Chloroflexota bacterium]
MFIIGTAGHIDHGKSALVQALTGIDPDRLPEEKRRGMTIDLGFAHLTLSSGEVVGIIDVPGHKDFMRNAIAGMWGIDAALLVVAADDGWMPQTEDHLRILDLFHTKYGIVVITKIDLIDQPDWLDMVEEDIRGRLSGTRLAGAPIVRVSAREGTNIEELKRRIETLVSSIPPKRDIGKPRLPIDRVFTVKGSGTVVTGTLIDGTMVEGQSVVIFPGNAQSRVRSLEAYKERTARAQPGTRVALNLVGLERQALKRGDTVFGAREQVKSSRILDVRLELIPQLTSPLKSNSELVVHLGTSEILGRVVLLEGASLKPGESALAQFRFKEGVAARIGDSFVIRKPTDVETLGGGMVLDPLAHRHKSKDSKVLPSLRRRESLDVRELVLAELDKSKYLMSEDILVASHYSQAEIEECTKVLQTEGQLVVAGAYVIDLSHWQEQSGNILGILATHVSLNPLEKGLAQADLQNRINLPKEAFDRLLAVLVTTGKVLRDGSTIAPHGHKPRLSGDQEATVSRIRGLFQKERTNPPTRKELAALLPGCEKVVRFMCEQNMLVELSDGVLLEYEQYSAARNAIIDFLRHHGRISIQQLRDILGLSRKYLLPLLIRLDEEGITRREGDERILAQR